MKSVSVKQLQEDLNRYLDEARAGEEVLIKERNKPVVKLVPMNGNGRPATQNLKPATKSSAKSQPKRSAPKKKRDYLTVKEMQAHEAKMVAEGRMRLPQVEPTPEFWDEFFKEPLADFGDLDVVRYISEDRDEDDEAEKAKRPWERDQRPLTPKELEAHVRQMAAEGRIILGKGPVPLEFFDEPLARLSTGSLASFISEDRDEE